MSENKQKFFNLSGWSWILYALLAALAITSIIASQSKDAPEWAKCKESLFQQMFSDTCTPRNGAKAPDVVIPASPGQDT